MNPADSVVMVMLCSKRLLGAFNNTDAAVPDAVVAVPAIVESRERAAPNATETAAGCSATAQPQSRLTAL